jgi:hypothetical protein
VAHRAADLPVRPPGTPTPDGAGPPTAATLVGTRPLTLTVPQATAQRHADPALDPANDPAPAPAPALTAHATTAPTAPPTPTTALVPDRVRPPRGLGLPLPADSHPPTMPVVQTASAGAYRTAAMTRTAAIAAGGMAASDGSIVFAAPPSPASGWPAQATPAPAVQREATTDPAPRPAPDAHNAEPATGEDESADTGTDLDEMADQLYDRVLFRLRRDLRHELERKGQHVYLRRA